MRRKAKREIFAWTWRIMGASIVIQIIGEFVHNLSHSEGLLEIIVTLIMSVMLGLFGAFAAAFSNEWGSPEQTPLMYEIYSWCSCVFYAALVASLFIGMARVDEDE